METIEKDIKRLSKLQVHGIEYYLLVILLIIVEPLVVITGGSIVTLLELIPNNQLNDVFGFFIGLFIIFPSFLYIGYWLLSMINPFKKIEYNLRKLHRLRKNIELEKENFNEIILISESLQNNIKNFDSPFRFSFLLSKDSRKKLHKIQEIIHKISYEILTDLRTDLLIRLTEQQQSLESAKSEVESHIKGTTELDQVSELQRIRLDKQIEQFEELQRVLVKA